MAVEEEEAEGKGNEEEKAADDKPEDGGKVLKVEVQDANWEGLIDETMTGLDCSDADMVPVYKSVPENDHIGYL